MATLTLDQLITDVQDRIDSEVADAVLLKSQFVPLTEQPAYLQHFGVAVVPPYELENTGELPDRVVERALARLTVQASYQQPIEATTDRPASLPLAIQFFASIRVALTGSTAWAAPKVATHETTEIVSTGGHWVGTQTFTFEGAFAVGT